MRARRWPPWSSTWIRRDERLVLLFSPPFARTDHDPGYIKAYGPGIRENGGQYTHAATWVIAALARLGEGDRAGEIFQLLNPIQHASRRANLHRYKGEPYAVAAHVYSQPPHVGRAGWTWYTGAAGWLYRAGLESMLGFQKQGAALRIDPCIPRHWTHLYLRIRGEGGRGERQSVGEGQSNSRPDDHPDRHVARAPAFPARRSSAGVRRVDRRRAGSREPAESPRRCSSQAVLQQPDARVAERRQ